MKAFTVQERASGFIQHVIYQALWAVCLFTTFVILYFLPCQEGFKWSSASTLEVGGKLGPSGFSSPCIEAKDDTVLFDSFILP